MQCEHGAPLMMRLSDDAAIVSARERRADFPSLIRMGDLNNIGVSSAYRNEQSQHENKPVQKGTDAIRAMAGSISFLPLHSEPQYGWYANA